MIDVAQFVFIWPLIKPLGQVESARVVHQPDVFLSDALEVCSKDAIETEEEYKFALSKYNKEATHFEEMAVKAGGGSSPCPCSD